MMVGRFMKSRSDTRKVNTMALSNLSKIRASLADDDELESDIMTPAVNEYQSEQVALYVSQMVGEMAAKIQACHHVSRSGRRVQDRAEPSGRPGDSSGKAG